MKIKSDFVTNSSSSSFIVFWPEKITSIDDVKKYITRDDFAKQIYEDSSENQCFHVSKIKGVIKPISEQIEHGYIPGLPEYLDYEKEFCRKNGITEEMLRNNPLWIQQTIQEVDILRKKEANKMALQLIEENEGSYVYFFEYSDESGGIFAELEHNNNWGGLPHIKISHH